MNLIDTLRSKQRLSQEQGEALYDLDLFTLGEFADNIRRERFGKKTFFNSNRHINPTNVCADVCKFCAFSANRKNPNPYTMSHEEIMETVAKAEEMGAKEIHIVSAHHPDAGMDWYMDIFKLI
ncbi:MAG: radical SAM protein, partial [Campylobacteraceae bacterium]|nr:radical SAM protein [Campylobacteraceae bacterium]